MYRSALCTEGRFARSSVWLTVVELGPLLWMLDSSLGTLGRQTLVRVIRVALLARCELYVHTSHKWGCFVHRALVTARAFSAALEADICAGRGRLVVRGA